MIVFWRFYSFGGFVVLRKPQRAASGRYFIQSPYLYLIYDVYVDKPRGR